MVSAGACSPPRCSNSRKGKWPKLSRSLPGNCLRWTWVDPFHCVAYQYISIIASPHCSNRLNSRETFPSDSCCTRINRTLTRAASLHKPSDATRLAESPPRVVAASHMCARRSAGRDSPPWLTAVFMLKFICHQMQTALRSFSTIAGQADPCSRVARVVHQPMSAQPQRPADVPISGPGCSS